MHNKREKEIENTKQEETFDLRSDQTKPDQAHHTHTRAILMYFPVKQQTLQRNPNPPLTLPRTPSQNNSQSYPTQPTTCMHAQPAKQLLVAYQDTADEGADEILRIELSSAPAHDSTDPTGHPGRQDYETPRHPSLPLPPPALVLPR